MRKQNKPSIFQILADGLDATCDGRGWDENHDKARRLADAAPEMLDALKELNSAPIWADPSLSKIHNQVKAVIAKAEGKL